MTGSDRSAAALELARENGAQLGLDVAWLRADLLDAGVPDEHDAILANLPYVAEGERAQLPPEILLHEPLEALLAGVDGLDAIRALIEQVGPRERVKLLALEVGAGQAATVVDLLCAAGFEDVGSQQDLAGIERLVRAERA